MLVKNAGSERRGTRLARWGLPLVLLALALVFGPLRTRGGGSADAPPASEDRPGELHQSLRANERSTEDDTAPANRLATLRIDLPEASARRLQAVRDRALEVGVIRQAPEDTVPGTVEFDGRAFPAEVRIKGDWLDHVESDQWSLRVTLDTAGVLGMRVFSIQALETVGYLWEWLVHESMRYEGVLAPRSTLVNVRINGNDAGIYFLQEHFAKELLESQQRREGPIVRFDETALWDLMLQNDLVLPVPPPMRSGVVVDTARVAAYGEKRLASDDTLRRALNDAIDGMRELRALAVGARTSAERLRRLEALAALEESSLERVVQVDRLACAHAVASLFQIEHGLFWHNLRFYFDPVLARLEPIMFDNMAHIVADPDPVPLRGEGYVTRFRTSRAYYDGVFEHLGRIVEPGYLEAFFDTIAPEFERLASALPPGAEATMKKRLFAQRDYLAQVARPVHAANFAGAFDVARDGDELEVTAWATTRSPVVVEGFRFGNGRFVRASDALDLAENGASAQATGTTQGVVLPHDSRAVRFRFATDQRLAGLGSVRELKQRIRAGESGAPEFVAPSVSVVYRAIAARDSIEEPLWFRRVESDGNEARRGRPTPPALVDTLAAHPFLSFDAVTGELVARAGTWEVATDLVPPEGTVLRVEAGTTLRFASDALLLVSGALLTEGTEDAPVVFEPGEDAATWPGVVVLEATARSTWTHTVVRGTRGAQRGGWTVTGGVTFYRSPLTMTGGGIEASAAEDGLNVFSADLFLDGVRFTGCASDSFDGDFVTGTIRACTFEDGAADGIDLSGSRVTITGCRFEDLGDKALSIGERSLATIDGGVARRVSIGIAAKDGSEVTVRSFGIEDARHFALAVFIKKEAFGPAKLTASGLRRPSTGSSGNAFVVQTGCELRIEGELVGTQDLDVEQLYRDGVLGR